MAIVMESLQLLEPQHFPGRSGVEQLLFKDATGQETKGKRKVFEDQDRDEMAERAIICRACKNKICSLSSSIEVNGRHQHTFYNPEGVIYQIGCFASAPGCVVHGKPTLHFTWFEGYRWSFALCGNCGVHLGWHYRAEGGSKFYGLIFNKLAEGG